MDSTLRKTRFVCLSDTHNASPLSGSFKLPKGDVLIHAGDLTNQGSISELRRTVDWIEKADFEVKIVIAGNHDITLDTEFYDQHGPQFHNQKPQDSVECIRLLRESPSIIYLNHQARVIRLQKKDGPRTTFKVFGSPYSPARGLWAFSYLPADALGIWNQIPLDTDVLVTHTPAKTYCDESRNGRAGCEDLRQHLWRVRPRLAVCGHIHEGRGVQRIKWNLRSLNAENREANIGSWSDTGKDNKKQSYIDLSSRSGDPLRSHDRDPQLDDMPRHGPLGLPRKRQQHDMEKIQSSIEGGIVPDEAVFGRSPEWVGDIFAEGSTKLRGDVVVDEKATTDGSAFKAYGAKDMLSGGDTMEALVGRPGRQETCVINAAIMASSWPHQGHGGRRYNKPIVVDVDLPAWDDNSLYKGV